MMINYIDLIYVLGREKMVFETTEQAIVFEKKQLAYWEKKKAGYKSQRRKDMYDEFIEWEKKELARLDEELKAGKIKIIQS